MGFCAGAAREYGIAGQGARGELCVAGFDIYAGWECGFSGISDVWEDVEWWDDLPRWKAGEFLPEASDGVCGYWGWACWRRW